MRRNILRGVFNHTLGFHHLHVRKRIHSLYEPYPHPNKIKRLVDRAAYAVGVFGPVMTIPQLAKIWVEKNAAGVSVVSWSAYLVTAIFWFFYGIIHKEKPIIVAHAIWIVMHVLIVTGTLIYGRGF